MTMLILLFTMCLPVLSLSQWEIIHQNKWQYFTSLDLINDSLGFATANDGQIIETRDGGNTWVNSIKLDVVGDLFEIQFVDKDHGWLSSSEDRYLGEPLDKLFRTIDGGLTWEELSCDISSLSSIVCSLQSSS